MRIAGRTLGLVVAAMFTSAQLQAQSIEFKGSTGGCFYVGSTCSATSFGFLSFTGGAFDKWTTSAGNATLSGANSLGVFSLGAGTYDYTGATFLLNVFFELPTLADPNVIYEAALLGDVEQGDGGVNIHFASSPVFYFNGPDYSGSFTLSVADVNLDPVLAAKAGATGFIQSSVNTPTVTPEPATMVLMATGFVGLVPAVRRRRRKSS